MSQEKKAGLLPFWLGLLLCPGLPGAGLLATLLCPTDPTAFYWALSLLLLAHLFLSCLTIRRTALPILFALAASARFLFLPGSGSLFRDMVQALCLGSLSTFLFQLAGALRLLSQMRKQGGNSHG